METLPNGGCGGCCAENTLMGLTDSEVLYMIEKGTKLRPIIPEHTFTKAVKRDNRESTEVDLDWQDRVKIYEKMLWLRDNENTPEGPVKELLDTIGHMLPTLILLARQKKDYYLLLEPCGNYDPIKGICTDYDNRPEICRSFTVGGAACRNIVSNRADNREIAVEIRN